MCKNYSFFVVLVLLHISTSGCFPDRIPIRAEAIKVGPPLETTLPNLKIGNTTRGEVENLIGPPNAVVEKRNLYIYFNPHSEYRDPIFRMWMLTVSTFQFDDNGVLREMDSKDYDLFYTPRVARKIGKNLRKRLDLQQGKGLSVKGESGKVSLLVRVQGIVDGEPVGNLSRRVGLEVGSLRTGGYMDRYRPKSLGEDFRKDGWAIIEVEPGNTYVGFTNGGLTDSVNPYKRAIKAVNWKIWRIEVPSGVPMIYAGTFNITGENKNKYADWKPVLLTQPPVLVDESDEAEEIVKKAFSGVMEIATSLAKEHNGPLLLNYPE